MSKRGLWLSIVAALALPITGGCDKINELTGSSKDSSKSKKKKDKDKDKEETESESSESADSSAKAEESAAPAASESAAPAASNDTAPTASDTAPPPPPPPPAPTGAIAGHSALPTDQEWSGVGEVTVLGSSKLNCETKAVREWVRVSCKGKNDTGGTPTGVAISKGGGRGDTFTFVSGGVASLVYPFTEGQDIAATFAWTDKRALFSSAWPHGAPKPAAFGRFDNPTSVATPVTPTATATATTPVPTATATATPTTTTKRPVLRIPIKRP